MPLATKLTAGDVKKLEHLRAKHYERPADMSPWHEYNHAICRFADVLLELALQHHQQHPDAVLEWRPPLINPMEGK